MALLSFGVIFLGATCVTFPNLGGMGLSLPFNNVVWLTTILFIYVAVSISSKKKLWIVPENVLISLLLVLFLIFPLIWSDDITGRGLYRLVGVVIGMAFFLSLFSVFTPDKERGLLIIIAISGFIEASWGLLQLFSNLYGWSLWQAGRPAGVFQQPNVFASYLATTYMAGLTLLFRFPFSDEKRNRLMLAGVIFFSYLVGILIFTLQSRTGYLSLAVALLLMMIAGKKSPKKNMWLPTFFLALGAVIGIINIGSTGNPDRNLLDTLSNPATVVAVSSSGRDVIWSVSWEMLKNNWLFGVGYGNFEPSFLEYQAQHFFKYGGDVYPFTNHPHNELLLWAVEGGFLPGAALILYSIYIIWRMYKLGWQALPYAAMLIPLAIHALLEYPFYHSSIHWILFLTILFLFELHASKSVKKEFKYKTFLKGITLLATLSAVVFFMTSLHAAYVVKKYYETGPEKRNILMLENIVNPVSVQPYLDYIALNSILTYGLATRDKPSLGTFLELANDEVRKYPRPGLYLGILHAYKALGDEDKFDEVLKKAVYYYPLDKRFRKLAFH